MQTYKKSKKTLDSTSACNTQLQKTATWLIKYDNYIVAYSTYGCNVYQCANQCEFVSFIDEPKTSSSDKKKPHTQRVWVLVLSIRVIEI